MHPDRSGSTNADPLAALRGNARGPIRERARQLIDRVPPEARPWAVALLATVIVAGVVLAVVVPAFVRGGAPAATGDWALDLPVAGTGSTAVTTPTATDAATLVVHAAGAVLRPGVYRLPPGSRVDDVIAAAGGLASDSDGNRVNLAATVADGERVYVPRLGEMDVPPVSGAVSTSGPAAGDARSTVDLNRATQQELESLPGIGPSIASAIIQHRERNGPFRSVDELIDVRGIGSARLEQLRDLVRV